MALTHLTAISSSTFISKVAAFLKQWENAPLIGDTSPTRDGAIHNDGAGIPTVGYGINLKTETATQISAIYKLALTGSTAGSLSTLEKKGLDLLLAWRAGGQSASSDLNLISKSQGNSGATAERQALAALWLTDAEATRVLEARLKGMTGLFSQPIEIGLRNGLSQYGASMPASSAEKLVLFSLYYNQPKLIGPGISAAIVTDNHAKFWYEVRYNHANYASNGLQNRREAESNLVGILSPSQRNDPKAVLKAMDFLFDRAGGTSSVYEKIAARDAVIDANAIRNAGTTATKAEAATNTFSAQLAPYLALLAKTYTQKQAIHFVQAGDDNERYFSAGVAKHLKLTEANTNDLIVAGNGGNNIGSGGGNDWIFSGKGIDAISLGAGNDHAVAGAGADTILGGSGNDVISGDAAIASFAHGSLSIKSVLPAMTVAGAHLDLPAELARLQQADGTLKPGLSDAGAGKDTIKGETGNDTLFGGGGTDTISGGSGNDVLLGGTGKDVLTGDDGNDRLSGGADADRMTGGKGDDFYLVDNAGDTVAEAGSGGVDTVILGIGGTFSFANVEIIALAEKVKTVTLSIAALDEIGTMGVDLLVAGNSANNRIAVSYAKTGSVEATFLGGGGNDTFVFAAPKATDIALHFSDFGAGDRVDLTSFNFDKEIASGKLDLRDKPLADGTYLFSAAIQIAYHSGTDSKGKPVTKTSTAADYFHTDSDWFAVAIDAGHSKIVTDLYGSMTGGAFLI